LISDTHGVLRPEAVEALQGVQHVIHAGDVGHPRVLEGLRAIAPLTAVRGNVDRDPVTAALASTEQVELAGVWFHVLHVLDDLDLDPAAAGFRVVVYGHSHRPRRVERGGVVYFNPGSAGPRRFRLPVTVARCEIGGNGPEFSVVHLDL
jgi:putative phosphoesterase